VTAKTKAATCFRGSQHPKIRTATRAAAAHQLQSANDGQQVFRATAF